MESNKKSVLKTVTWRIAHSFVAIAVAFFITHSLKTAAEILSAEIVWETALFYVHERGWSKWGRKIK
jgi:uncharacterized membrane protein